MKYLLSSARVKTFTNQYDFVGGIAGYINDSNIEQAYFDGYVEPCQQPNNLIVSRVGGIVAFVESTGHLSYCVNNGSINSNTKYDEYTHIGGIIGYSQDRTFANDIYLIYNDEEFAGYKGVGLYDVKPYIKDNRTEAEAKVLAEADILANFTTAFSGIRYEKTETEEGTTIERNFDMNYWYNKDDASDPISRAEQVGFDIFRTYITGNDTSLSLNTADNAFVGADLYKSGALVKKLETAELKRQASTFNAGDTLVISGRNNSGGYFYKKFTINSATEAITLGSFISATDDSETAFSFSKSIVCFVQLIPTQTATASLR